MEINCPKCGVKGDVANGFCRQCHAAFDFDPRFFAERKIPASVKVWKVLRNVLPLAGIAFFILLIAMFFVTPSVQIDYPEGAAVAAAKAKGDAFEFALINPDSTPERTFKLTVPEVNAYLKDHIYFQQDGQIYSAVEVNGSELVIHVIEGRIGILPVYLRLYCYINDENLPMVNRVKIGKMPGMFLTATAVKSAVKGGETYAGLARFRERLESLTITDDGEIVVKLKK